MRSPIEIDITQLPPSGRHEAIFSTFERLEQRDKMILSADHDPQPVYYELKAKYPKCFTWDYMEEGPKVWRVLITRQLTLNNRKVADLLLENVGLADIFTEFGIDFCCQGNTTLEEACRVQKIDVADFLSAIGTTKSRSSGWRPHFDLWSSRLLIYYILENHHAWESSALEEISDLVEKVGDHHGKKFPVLYKIRALFLRLRHALLTHHEEEEAGLFPLILEGSKSADLLKALERMKSEHTDMAAMLSDLSLLTNNFQPASGACDSYRLLFHKLKELKADIQQRICIENSVLAPKAVWYE